MTLIPLVAASWASMLVRNTADMWLRSSLEFIPHRSNVQWDRVFCKIMQPRSDSGRGKVPFKRDSTHSTHNGGAARAPLPSDLSAWSRWARVGVLLGWGALVGVEGGW